MVIRVSVGIGRGIMKKWFLLSQQWEEVLPQRHSLCSFLVLSFVSFTLAWQSTDVFIELRTPCASPLAPNLHHHWAPLHRNSSCTSCPVQFTQHLWCRNATVLHGSGAKQGLGWTHTMNSPGRDSLQTSDSHWQHRTRDCTKVALQRGKEKEAPQESAQTRCWAILRSQAQTFTFTPELETKPKGTDSDATFCTTVQSSKQQLKLGPTLFLPDKIWITAQSWNFSLGKYSLNKRGPYSTYLMASRRFVKSLLCNTWATSPDFIWHLLLGITAPPQLKTASLASQQSYVNTNFTISRSKASILPRDRDTAY